MAADPPGTAETHAPSTPPPAYGAGSSGAPSSARPDRTDAAGAPPVYGRVPRYGSGPADASAAVVPSSRPGTGPAPGLAPGLWPPPDAPPPPPGPGPWAPQPPGLRPDLGLPPGHLYASWWRRVAGWAIDSLPWWVAATVLTVGYVPLYAGLLRGDFGATPSYWVVLVGTLLYVAAFGWDVYNRWFLAGRTGQSVGKRVAKTWLVSQDSGRPVGTLTAFVRDLLHVLDRLGYIGYLWPLWDDQRQTLADKVARTVVVRTRVAPLAPGEAGQLVV